MDDFNEYAFDGAVEIVAAAMEEAEVELSAQGGEKVAEFFRAVYKGLSAAVRGEEPVVKPKPGSFEVFQDAKGEYRFRLKAANGEIISVSEGYKKKASCLKGVESLRRSAPEAKVVEKCEEIPN